MTINYQINKPVEKVYAALSDMQLFVAVHPVVYKIEQLGAYNYQFYEQLKFFPVKFNYNVTIQSLEPNKNVQMYAQVQKGVKLYLSFTLNKMGNTTQIQEIITIKAPVFIKQIFELIIKKAHRDLFKNIGLSADKN